MTRARAVLPSVGEVSVGEVLVAFAVTAAAMPFVLYAMLRWA